MLLAAACLGALAGCGGGDEQPDQTVETLQTVRGPGYTFQAPPGWEVSRTARRVRVAAPGEGAPVLEVYVFRTVKRYDPMKWPAAAAELDRTARKLAANGRLRSSRTVRVAGDRARQYLIEHPERQALYTFLYRRRSEFELICHWPLDEPEPAACATAVSSFRPG